jgi:hypothetical protein
MQEDDGQVIPGLYLVVDVWFDLRPKSRDRYALIDNNLVETAVQRQASGMSPI